jgi:hypothetical protein
VWRATTQYKLKIKCTMGIGLEDEDATHNVLQKGAYTKV